MTKLRRLTSGLLSLALVGSTCTAWLPTAASASSRASSAQTEPATGSISLTLSFDLPQRMEEVESRTLRMYLTDSNNNMVADADLSRRTYAHDGRSVSVNALNVHGAEWTTEEQIGAFEAVVSGLPAGTYTLTVSGTGYATSTTKVELTDYSRHVLMSTADGTFSLGDVTGDGLVNNADRAEMTAHLGTTDALEIYDLNGDGVVDVVDLSYVNQTMNLTGEPRILSTMAIVTPQVDDTAVMVEEGTLDDLFADSDTSVTLKPTQEAAALSIPITLDKPTEMSEIAIASPSVKGAIQEGTALVEYENGTQEEFAFGGAAPAGVHAIGRNAGQSVVTINLGKKVPVKKVTITVTKVEGQTGDKPEFATITQIAFLKDIVSEETKADTQVKGLAATVGDGAISLAWNSVNNVTGYVAKYSTSKDELSKASCPSVSVGTNKATVTDLENGTTYYFQVTATSANWSGTPSAILSAAPVAANAPGAPTDLRVESADSALRLSWSKAKDATYYQVFYRMSGASVWTQWGSDQSATSAVITGLTNGTTYQVAVKAGNLTGLSPLSSPAEGIPDQETFALPELPDDGRIDNGEITSIVMADPNNVNWDLAPNFQVGDLIDHNANTYWIARNYWYDSNITYTFQNTHNMNYLLVVPYLDETYKNRIANFTVTLKGADGEVLATYYRDGMNITGSNYYILSFPETKDVKSVTLALGEKTGGPRVSIAEIAFYNSNTLADEIAALFANHSYTQLSSGVTEETIGELQERLTRLGNFYLDKTRLQDELDLAQALLSGSDDTLGLVKNDFQSRSASAAADQAAGQSASDLQPLGITARAGATVAIYAELPDDQPVYVVPTQFYGESGIWKGSPVPLKNGRNYITVEKIGSLTDTRGGMLYLTYAGANPQEIRLQVRVLDNAWEMPVLELSDWYDMTESQRKDVIGAYVQELSDYVDSLQQEGITGEALKTAVRNATEISTPSVLLSLPADQVLAGLKGVNNADLVETMYNNVLAWEEELFVANMVQGIVDSDQTLSGYEYPMTTRQNIRYMRMFPGAFMYAAGNHIGVEYGSTAALAQGKPTSVTRAGSANGLFGWGIAHEIGHNMDKLGRAEITNNLYSLALQAWDGDSMALETRLTTDGRWAQIFDKVAQARPGAANNVFVQLGMYWQLHLAYDEADQPLRFYNQFFTLWKSGEYSNYSYDERVALVASKVADRNLTEFFTRWGMVLSDDVKAVLGKYPSEERAIWYLNDASRNYRLENGAAASGTVQVGAAVEDATVTLNIYNIDSDTTLGYEIRRNGTAIGFTTQDTYTDDLGAANNLTYTYSVVPVDKLGNWGKEAEADEVRVAYDKTIDPKLYDLVRAEDGTITITMKGGAVPVTGLKVTGAELSGHYTATAVVQVTDEEGQSQERTVSVKSGTLSGTELVAYFTKPGAPEDDTRIWTYSVVSLTLTGIPENAQVQLLDYPGDRVDFYEGATVGILKHSYEGIPAGTLVILGTYRGDPRFNIAEIEARYNTTGEADEANQVTFIERPMNGELYLLAEIPADGAVSDTSDGFFLFVPNLEAEKKLNLKDNVTDDYPIEIRANFYRTDDPNNADSKRLTSQTLWISFPDGGSGEDPVALPEIVLTSDVNEQKG